MIDLLTPISDIHSLNVGDMVRISGHIFCGRDAVLPKIAKACEESRLNMLGINLEGSVVFHTAVSPAGVGPTSSNKLEIESSIAPLSKAGVKMHLGKGAISINTVKALDLYHSVYAVIPPVTALLKSRISMQQVVAFAEEGMEALHMLKVNSFPCIIAAAHGKSIYD
jgi:fumarate hydratase subunit beta